MPYSPPEIQHLDKILPEEPLLLMGAGPVPISHSVSRANGVVINHLGETMDAVINNVKIMGRYAFQTNSEKIIGVSGPASAAMEMAITNLLWPGRSVLSLSIGTFSSRMADMAQGVGADVTVIKSSGIAPIRLEQVEKALSKKKFDVVTVVQGETSCGIEMKCLPEISKIVKEHGALLIVDAVCTLTTMPLQMDEWGVDAVIAGGQKGLSSIPGVSLIAFSEAAWSSIESRKERHPHWCLNALLAQTFWGSKKYHYTAPVPGILALHEALRQICEETLPIRFERHRICSIALQSGIETMGLKLFIPIKDRLNSVIAISCPKEIESSQIRKNMSNRFHVEISGAFGLDILRIGQMGEQCRSHNLFKVLYALGMSCRLEGIDLDISLGMAELESNLMIDLENLVD